MKAALFLLFILAAVPLAAQSLDPKPSPTAMLSQDELESTSKEAPAAAAEQTAAGEPIRPIARPAEPRSFRRLRAWGADSRDRLRRVGERHRSAAARRR